MKLKIAIVAAVAALAALAMTTAASAKPEKATATAKKAAPGGTYRVEWEASFDFSDGFDPTGEYLGEAFGIYSNLLVRTLVGYNHVAGAPGNVLVPDIATDLGKISNGGKTYTYKIKQGVKFGPPLNRQVTSADFKFAFERIKDPKLAAGYGFYYNTLKSVGDAGSADGRVQPHEADRRLPPEARDACHGPDAQGSRGLLHRGREVRPLRHVRPART